MKYFNLKLSVVLMICILVVISCSFESDLIPINSNEQNESIDMRSENLFDLPVVTQDRYSFRDFDHLTSYYQSMDMLYSEDDQAFNEAAVLNRRGVNTVHHKLFNDEFTDPEDRYQPFLTDPVMMTIVNEYFEFEVDNVLITYMNNRDLLICDPNDSETKTAIRNLPKGGELNFNSIPSKAYWGEDTNIESLRAWCGCAINIEQINCNQVRVYGTCKNFIFGDGGGIVNIFLTNSPGFPANGTTPSQTSSVNGNFSFTLTMNNSSSSTFIHASANPNCFFNNLATSSLEFDPNQNSCDPDEKDSGWLWATDNGVQGMSYRTAYYKTFWSSYEEAKIFSKHWTGTEWEKNDADLRVEIDAHRKNKVCVEFVHEEEFKTCFCDNKRARVNSGTNDEQDFVFHCDGDVIGTYKKTLNWQGDSWSIDAVADIDFECCE